MKAIISPKGALVIIPENETETFALTQWNPEKHMLMLCKQWPVTEPLTASPVCLSKIVK